MSLTYAEIYQNKIRNKNKQNNENKINTNNTNNIKNLKIISLIKKFPAKKRKTFETNINFKPRRIKSKSVQTIQKYRKESSQKKEKLKNNLDNNDKNKNLNKAENNNNINNKNSKKNQRKKNTIYENNEIENKDIYKSEMNTELNSPKDNIKNKCHTLLSQTYKKNTQIDNNKENNENNTNDQNYNTANFLEINKYNIPNKFDTLSKSNKSSFNSLDTYFDIFRLRQQAANFKDKLKYNNINKYNSENDLNKIFNIARNTSEEKKYQKIKSFSAFVQKKSKTYYKAIKLKEEIEKNITNNNNINNQMYSSCNNFFNNNNKDNENNQNIVEEMNQHFFDINEERPKVMKKFLTNNGTFNFDKNNIKTKIFSSNFNLYNDNKNENCKNGDIYENNLMTKFSSELYQIKYKRRSSLNNKSLNLIIEENQKLNNLLRKIPSNKDSKDRSYDLINYISQIRKKDNKIKYMKSCKYNFNNKFDVYPANVWKEDYNTFE